MAQKSGKIKRFFMLLIFLALLVIVFILLGGGNLLKSASTWLGGVGNKAQDVKQTIEQKAEKVGKTVKEGIDTVKPGEKK